MLHTVVSKMKLNSKVIHSIVALFVSLEWLVSHFVLKKTHDLAIIYAHVYDS